jgi:hypothetical protein
MSEKTILEQALLQVQTLEEAVKQNAKGILASTMKQELSDLLKESLEEEEKVEESTEVSEEESAEPKEEEKDMSEQPEDEESDDEDVAGDDESNDDSENDDTLDNEDPSKGIDSMDSEDDAMDSDDTMGELPASDEDSMEDDDVMDLTGASDDEVLKVFKAMKPEDGIVVKKDGDNVSFEDGNDEYIIKLDEEGDESMEEESVMDEESWNEEESPVAEEDSMEEDSLYEIELGEEEEKMEEEKEEDVKEEKEEEKESEKVEATEAARTKWNPHGDKGGAKRAGIKSKKVFKAGSGALNEEVENLKKQNAEYKKALVLFKEKLNEVAVFNANLAYATRLFTEHSTTKQEKLNILKRFDSISTLNESKNLFNTIKTELSSKITVTETVVEKISNTPSTSSSQEVLAESKAYENPQFKRMKDLMGKLK